MNPYRLTRPAQPSDEPRHVIAEYKHRDRLVTCVCGWRGSAPGAIASPDDWNAHLASTRTRKR